MYVSFVARFIFAVVFLCASLNKMRNPAAFVQTIQQIGFGSQIAKGIAWLVIGYEALLAFLFFFGYYPTIATIAALVLLMSFAVISVRAIQSKQKITCNCFGESKSLLGKGTLTRAVLLGVPVICYYMSARLVGRVWWPANMSELIILCTLVLGIIALAQWVLFLSSFLSLIESRKQKERRTEAIKRHEILEQFPSTGGAV
ncbi:MAG TPA: MauE/DoxX family redox-associated membrane protein [Ktedonobacteraceae bacterium]|nr:MauE/DoxX family redox-associated membrane protein [Ktedonobacteraceae bacterium]